jgi:uncharacterized SAM-binding protein YcdF (DUF218 family)
MKLILSIAGYVAIFALAVWGISSYLGPDDLKKCGTTPSGQDGCQKADAIVAISGGDTRARTNEAIKLYQNGWANELVFSGAALDPSSPSNAEAMRVQAIEAGIPARNITIEEFAQNTEQNAVKTNELVDGNIRRIILVTSAYHQRRANMEFQQAFADVEVIDSPVQSDKHWPRAWWLTPTGWWLSVSEFIKILFVSSK